MGSMCFYCHKDIATQLDHIIPYSYSEDNSIHNLVPCCGMCNVIATDKVFSGVDEKQEYILRHRQNNTHYICRDCLLPFVYRENSPSLFLCAYCYDQEYGTEYAKRKQWEYWIKILEQANIIPMAHHRNVKLHGRCTRNNKVMWIQLLQDEYENYCT